MKHATALRSLCSLAAALVMSLAPCALAQQVPELLDPVSVQADTFVARRETLSKLSLHDASIVPYVEALSLPQEGRISQVEAAIGQRVLAGQRLLTLNCEEETRQIESLNRDIAALDQQGVFEQQLYDIDMAILEAELRRLQASPEATEEAVALKQLDMEELMLTMEMSSALRGLQKEQLQAKLDALMEKTGQSILCAPFDGVIIHMAEVSGGDTVSAYEGLIFLADESRLNLRATFVSGAELSSAHSMYALIGDGRYAIAPVEADPDEYVPLALSGETPTTAFTLLQMDESIAPGMYAAVCIERLHVEDALVVPSNALYQDESGRYLYVLSGGQRLRRDVETGATNDIMTQITQGLEEGEIVCVKE